MVFTPPRDSSRQDQLRVLLEDTYHKRNLVHLSAGSAVPLLRNSIWLVVRGMVKLGAISIHGDELLLGLAGPNEPFGEPMSNVEAYEASTLADSDLLCFSLDEIEQTPYLAMALLRATTSRMRQSEALIGLL
jgi:CRP-like cAMP-binding protein